MLRIRRVVDNDIGVLTEIKKKAFEEEFKIYGFIPEDMISKQWHENMKRKSLYYAITDNGDTIGGVNIFSGGNGEYYLCSIFINSIHQNKGFGTIIMQLLEDSQPDWKRWYLETPNLSKQNHHFYEKCGYKYIKEEFPKNAPEGFSLRVYERTRAY